MPQAIELETYRAVVLLMIERLTGLSLPTQDGIPTDERIERAIRRYRVSNESCRNCANAIIACEV